MSVYGCNMNLELQQRAVEYNTILRKYENMREGLFEQMPPIELKLSSYANTSATNIDDASGVGDEEINEEERKREEVRAKEEAAKTLIDIFSDETFSGSVSPPSTSTAVPSAPSNDLDILNFLGQVPVPSALAKNQANELNSIFSSNPIVNTFHIGQSNGLEDLLGISAGSVSVPSQSTTNPNDLLGLFTASTSALKPVKTLGGDGLNSLIGTMGTDTKQKLSTLSAYEKNDIKVIFETAPDKSSSLEHCFLQVKVENQSINNFVKDFEFSAAVPKTMQIQITPPFSNTMQPLDSLRLVITILNPKKVDL